MRFEANIGGDGVEPSVPRAVKDIRSIYFDDIIELVNGEPEFLHIRLYMRGQVQRNENSYMACLARGFS